ncbi:MAG: hypothetical protein AUH92_02470 [Acidobacteria bacterium 13_1_40CM_4_69_4]|nr:MAG: hypothetical protein AUH92_02470 [Acidobacteria bacterium 13_1_40CM_4_69_4]
MQPRVIAALIAAVLCLAAAPAFSAQTRERGPSPKATASPATSQESGEARWRSHIHISRSRSSVTISDVAYVPKGAVHDDDLVAILGKVRVEGEVTGDVVVILGSMEISGKVDGDVVGIMTPMHIADEADISGDMVSVGGPLSRPPGAHVGGETVNLNFLDFVPFLRGGFSWWHLFLICLLIKLAKLAGLFLVLLLITALVPRRLSLIAEAFPKRWGTAVLAGLLGYCLAIALGLAAKLIKWIGLASLLFLLGQRIGRNVLKRDLSHFASVLGGFAVYAIFYLVPILGGFFAAAMSVLALGISILTRFGSEEPWRKPGTQATPPTGPPPLDVAAPSPGS